MLMTRAKQQGFTLIEVMVVVAIIGILAAVVVPMFTGESRKAKALTEVSPMFTELATKEDQYKGENGSYLAVAACPATPSATLQDISACKSAADWTALRIAAPEDKLRCSYQVVVGAAGTAPTAVTGFTFPSGTPANSWYYLLATCDMDGVSSTTSQYLQSSLDSTIQKYNEGK